MERELISLLNHLSQTSNLRIVLCFVLLVNDNIPFSYFPYYSSEEAWDLHVASGFQKGTSIRSTKLCVTTKSNSTTFMVTILERPKASRELMMNLSWKFKIA